MKYVQSLVRYSSINIELFMKILIIQKFIRNYFGGLDFISLFFELFEGLDVIINVRFQKNMSC